MSITPTSSEDTWWGWFQTAKDQVVSQSSEVFEYVKKDIDEFKKVVTDEASSMINSTSATLKEKLKLDEETSATNTMKKSVSGFLSHVAEVFTPTPDDGDEEAIIIHDQQPVFLGRLQAAIYAIQKDSDTFLLDPIEEKVYEEWLKSFDLKNQQEDIAQLLADSEPLHQNYQDLVPTNVSHVVFWHRYFYKVEKLEEAETKRQEISKRAQETKESNEIKWDEDEQQVGANANMSENVQNKLLEDYEKEFNVDRKKDEPKRKLVKKEVTGDGSEGNSALVTTPSLDNFSSASSNLEEINDEEWEKINKSDSDLSNSRNSPIKDSSTDKSEDWEKWE